MGKRLIVFCGRNRAEYHGLVCDGSPETPIVSYPGLLLLDKIWGEIWQFSSDVSVCHVLCFPCEERCRVWSVLGLVVCLPPIGTLYFL